MAYLLDISTTTLEVVTCHRFESGKTSTVWPLCRKDITRPPYMGWEENCVPSINHCERIPDEFIRFITNPLPIQLETEKPLDSLPDFWGTQGFRVVTREFKDIVESCEPQRHQFIGIELIDRKTRNRVYGHQEFFILNILTLIKPNNLISARDHIRQIVVDRRVVKEQTVVSYMYSMRSRELVIRTGAIGGFHVWSTRDCIEEDDYDRPLVHWHGLPTMIMVSNECGARLKAAALTGFDLTLLKETNALDV